MVGVNCNILDLIAIFAILLSDAPAYWFTLNTSWDHVFHLAKQIGMNQSEYRVLLLAGNLACRKDVWRKKNSGIKLIFLSTLSVSCPQ
jgi:hypothetical protein